MAAPQALPNSVLLADRKAACLDLRRTGMPIRAIAVELGIAKSTVQDYITEGIADIVEPRAEQVRALELERLDSWQARLEKLLDVVGEDQVKVIMGLLRVSESRRRLLGLDAPVAVDARGELKVTVEAVNVEKLK